MGKADVKRGIDRTRENRLSSASIRQSNLVRSQSRTPDYSLTALPNQDYLRTSGGIMLGPQGGYAQALTISSGILDLTTNASSKTVKIRPIIFVSPESGTVDTLDALEANGKELNYMQLRFVGVEGNTITITHNFGSATGTQKPFLCPSDTDYTLTNNEVIDLMYDETTDKWLIVSGGGGNASFPLDYSIDDQGTKSTGTVTHDLSLSTAHMLKFTIGGDLTVAFSNYPTSGTGIDWYVEVTQDGTGGHTITWPSEITPALSLTETANTVSLVSLHTNDGGTTVRAITLLNASPVSAGANTTLSNLGTTAINASLLVDTTASYNLGSDANRFSNLWAGTVNVGDSTDTQNITGTASGIQYDTGKSTHTHDFQVNNTSKLTISNTQITAFDNLSLNSNSLDNVSAINGDNSQTITPVASGWDYDVNDVSDFHTFQVAGTDILYILDEGEIQWPKTGFLHQLVPSLTSLQFNLGGTSDTFKVLGSSSEFDFNVSTSGLNYINTSHPADFSVLGIVGLSALDNDEVGRVRFFGSQHNGAVASNHEYGNIIVTSDDVTTGTTDASMKINLRDNGTLTEFVDIDGGNLAFHIKNAMDLDMNGADIENVDDLAFSSPTTYTITNVTTDRTYDANSTTVAELADVLGTLIADLQARRMFT